MEETTFIDLFAGIGGFRLALESVGYKCVFSSEIDKYARQTYKENFNEEPAGDITKIDVKDIPRHDILCAGFPCQPFSIAGKRLGRDDKRGVLFDEILRIAEYHKPKYLLLENVKGLLSINNRQTFKDMITALEGLGYIVNWKVLNAKNFGVPQNRERVFIVCTKDKPFKFPEPLNIPTKIKDILEGDVDKKYFISDTCKNSVIKKLNVSNKYVRILNKGDCASALCVGGLGVERNFIIDEPERIGHLNKGGQGDRIYSETGLSVCLSANGGGIGAKTGLYEVNNGIRKLTPRECARLQGFPDSFKIVVSNTQAYKQFGNAVCVSVVKEIAKNLEGE